MTDEDKIKFAIRYLKQGLKSKRTPPLYEQLMKELGLEELEKANEWHYVKDGDLPEEDKSIMIYAKLADGVAVGKRRKQGKVYEWYFATYDGTFCLRDKEVIAWKEIVLPKESEA